MTMDRTNYPGVPEDFPVTATVSAVSGAQPKMNLVEEGGRFYAPGTSPGEVLAAFQMCDDLVSQMVPAGQTRTITGAPPLDVVIGNAAEVRATLHGQPLDLAPYTQRNVARFAVE